MARHTKGCKCKGFESHRACPCQRTALSTLAEASALKQHAATVTRVSIEQLVRHYNSTATLVGAGDWKDLQKSGRPIWVQFDQGQMYMGVVKQVGEGTPHPNVTIHFFADNSDVPFISTKPPIAYTFGTLTNPVEERALTAARLIRNS